VHLQAQEAAGVLIEILISQGNLFDAERYAQVTYGNLRDKKNGIDQESEAVATGAYNLADVIYQQSKAVAIGAYCLADVFNQQLENLVKAEELARESLRILSLINDSNHHKVGRACGLLADILRGQHQLGSETRGLYERYLAISILNSGLDGLNTASGNYSLGVFCHQLAGKQATVDLKQTQLLLAKAYFEESNRINSKIHGHTYPQTVNAASKLAAVSRELSRITLA
jgi:hypothetical protein